MEKMELLLVSINNMFKINVVSEWKVIVLSAPVNAEKALLISFICSFFSLPFEQPFRFYVYLICKKLWHFFSYFIQRKESFYVGPTSNFVFTLKKILLHLNVLRLRCQFFFCLILICIEKKIR